MYIYNTLIYGLHKSSLNIKMLKQTKKKTTQTMEKLAEPAP